MNPRSHAHFRKNTPEAFKSCFDAAKRKISKKSAHPAKKYGFTKQKHIRGDKTLNKYNFGPNVIWRVRVSPSRRLRRRKGERIIYNRGAAARAAAAPPPEPPWRRRPSRRAAAPPRLRASASASATATATAAYKYSKKS